jgi:hypothetical protein
MRLQILVTDENLSQTITNLQEYQRSAYTTIEDYAKSKKIPASTIRTLKMVAVNLYREANHRDPKNSPYLEKRMPMFRYDELGFIDQACEILRLGVKIA